MTNSGLKTQFDQNEGGVPVEDEFESYDDTLYHIGIKRRSGRYPWGSGKDPEQRARDFKGYYNEMKSKGLSDKQIAESVNLHLKKGGGHENFATTNLRAAIAVSTEEISAANRAMATRLHEKGLSNSEIARRMKATAGPSTNESTVRGWLKQSNGIKEGSLRSTADMLKGQLETKDFLDVGAGTHLYAGVSKTKFNTSLAMLADEGYRVHSNIKGPQLGTGNLTTYKVLTKGDVEWGAARRAVLDGKLSTISAHSDDNGLTYKKPKTSEPVSIDLKRVAVKWAEDGGTHMDGVIELRRNVEDLNLGAAKYAQVRIAVNGTHYLKGMAQHADDLPPGIDIRFNTNKSRSSDKLAAMKPLKEDPRNRFGASTYPRVYKDKSGKEKTSALNIVNEEGDWDKWSKSLSSQMLSKQSVSLASAQLGKARDKRTAEYNEILKLTNPVVRQKLLNEFAENADSAAVHLKAAAFERQSTHVILPMNSMRPHEIYAPNFNHGEKVVLVRHPHGGPFEIPELTVNNRNRIAASIMKGAKDAVGIHHTVAEQLSGADFDGDTVLVIPNDHRKVKTRPPLAGLKNFDPKTQYGIPESDTKTPRMTKKNTQTEMGKISNLITDMTIHNASDDELARAVRHSMVVIDAEKHGLNYKLSEKDNGIAQLKTKYQGGPTKGASTLISRASSDARVPEQKPRSAAEGGPVDRRTGEKVFTKTGVTYTKTTTRVSKRTGEVTTKVTEVPKTTKGTKMEFAKDARSLLSAGGGTPMERVYADYANTMKGLANSARKAALEIKIPPMSKAAAAVYSHEVKSLKNKLQIAEKNAPLERQAQAIANARSRARIEASPWLDKDAQKKIKFQELEDARLQTGAAKQRIGALDAHGKSTLTEREWEAIQAGAVSPTVLRQILANADMARVRDLATPKPRTVLTVGQQARIASLAAQGRSLSEIALALGVPRSTVADQLR